MTFKKGFDANRHITGRPPTGQSLPELIRAAFERYDANGVSEQERVIKMALAKAKHGSYQLLGMLWDRGYGKVPDKVVVDQEPQPDFSKLTDEEIAEFERLLKKAKP